MMLIIGIGRRPRPIADRGVQRKSPGRRGRLSGGDGDREDRVGAEPTAVRGAVRLPKSPIDGTLICHVDPAHGVEQFALGVGHSSQHAVPAVALAAVAQLPRLVGAGRSAGWHDRTAAGTSPGHDVAAHRRAAS